ncbi:MMPL family transporter [Bacillus sp. FSL M8-0052]|uniref:MMPL family transporter n=1 Tax=Bacillus sp. FSL M8-0052 TaxID=2978203 RepID=UPI0030F76AB8
MLIGWLCILAVAGAVVFGIGTSFDGEIAIPGTKSEKAGELLKKKFPSGNENGTIQLIFKAPKGETLESDSVRKKIQETLKEAVKDKAVKSVAAPYQSGTVNKDKKIGYATITYQAKADQVTEASKDKIKKVAKEANSNGIQTELGGTVEFSELEIGGASEIVGVVIAYFILAFTFASFLAAGLPIITALIGLANGLVIVMIGSNFTTMTSVSLSLAVMIGLAVGIDYALFIISSFRKLRADELSVRESVARAVGTAGSAVVFAGVTVIIALCGLSVVGIPFLANMGFVAAVVVFFVVLVAITAVPAVLSLVGERISPARKNKWLGAMFKSKQRENSDSNAWGRFITRYPILIVLGSIILTAVISLPALHLDLGMPDNGMKSKDTIERKAYDLMAEGFGDGVNGPLVIVADASNEQNHQAAIQKAAKELEGISNIDSISPPIPNSSGEYAMINITPSTGPKTPMTKKLVEDIRDKAEQIAQKEDVKFEVTGPTAVNIDISNKLTEALSVFILIVVGFAFVLLVVVFRSILIPLKAVLGFIMTLTATLGFTVSVLQDGYLNSLFGIPATGPVLNFLPILVIGILFGLAMDYEVFLVSSIREEYVRSGNARKSILSGLKHSGAVVSAAGLIMIFIFASFIFGDDITIKSMGLALAFGVLFDAFVVRMTLVPAVMSLLGRSAWYLPKWLDRILLKVDIEGVSLIDELEGKEAQNIDKAM